MALTRRQFLTLVGGSAAGSVVFQACGVPPDALVIESPIEMPEDMVTGLENWYATVCRQCPTSEGIVVRIIEGRAKKVEGNVDYPVNMGKHSARCEAGLQELYHPDRIVRPLLRVGPRGSGQFQGISWDDAIGRLTFQLQNLQNAGGQAGMVLATNAIGSHQALAVQSFVSSYGGRHMVYEPLERTNLHAAIKQVFNQDVMPDFDIANSAYILSFGADFLNTWVSPVRYAYGYGNFRQGDRERGRMVHIEPRMSMTAANADRWVYVRPGMEGVLALSIAHVIISEGLGDAAAASALTGNGAVDLSAFAPEAVSERTGVPADRIHSIAVDFATHRPALAIGGGSAAAHTNGLFNLAAIYSLNYLVGSVGQPGGIVFNPTSPLPDLPARVPTNAFAEWRELADSMRRGEVQVFMARNANPLYGLPASIGFEDALLDAQNGQANVPFIFSISSIMDETAFVSDLILPEHVYLEDWGSDIPNPGPGFQVMAFQQPVVRPVFEERGPQLGTKNFINILMATAQGLGLDLGLPGENALEVVQSAARELFETGRGTAGPLQTSEYPDFRNFWVGLLQNGFWKDESARGGGGASAPPQLPNPQEPEYAAGGEFYLMPFTTTGIGDGTGAFLPWLQATPDPISTAVWRTWVEINAQVAESMGISDGDVIQVTAPNGRSIEALAYPNPGTAPDVLGVSIGQGHNAGGRYAQGRGSNVYSILEPLADSQTGQLAWAATRVSIQKTGRWVRLPKFQNTIPVPPRDEGQHVLKLTPQDT